jgi:hypothetical protein
MYCTGGSLCSHSGQVRVVEPAIKRNRALCRVEAVCAKRKASVIGNIAS